ncbi:hypothetical protein NMG60_11009775 [Bertholletia excelsa]
METSKNNPGNSIYGWFLQVVVLWVMIFFFICLSVTPKSPSFTVTNLRVEALNSSSSTNSTSLAVNLLISNPNKRMGIYYRDMLITLRHESATVGLESVPGFYQGAKRKLLGYVLVKARFGQSWRTMAEGVVNLNMVLETEVRYEVFAWKTKRRRMVFYALLMVDSMGRMYGEKNVKLHAHKSKTKIES